MGDLANSLELKFHDLINSINVPKLHNGFDQPCGDSDFTSYKEDVDNKFQGICEFIDNEICCLSLSCINKLKIKCLVPTIIVCGQHSSFNYWTTENSIERASFVLNKTLKLFQYSCLEEALASENCSLFKRVLINIRPCLRKDSWKNYPAAIICYSWLLEHVKSPNLSDHLDLVLPTALIFTDDFFSEYRIIGLKSLTHIINNVTMTNLAWYGQDEVILKALEPIFYQKDAEIIPPLIETFVALLNKKEPLKSQQLVQWNEFDNLIDKFISGMVLEQKLTLRSVYISALGKIIQARGLAILFNSSCLLSIFTEYILEPTSSLDALRVLKIFIDVCWPRIHLHCNSILLLMSKCFLGLQTQGYPSECLSHVESVISRLNILCPEQVNNFLLSLNKEDSLKDLEILVERTIKS